MKTRNYLIPDEVEYAVERYVGVTYPDMVRVHTPGRTNYAWFYNEAQAKVDADNGSLAAKAALMYYADEEEAKWEFGDVVTEANHPSKSFWFVDNDMGSMSILHSARSAYKLSDPDWEEYGPYRFVGFVKENDE